MLIPHALGALETAEARSLESHLRACAECRDELDGWHETATTLAFAVNAAEPSAELRTRILEQAREVRQPASEQKSGRRDVLETFTNETSTKSSDVIPMPSASKRAWDSRQLFGAIAASLIIAALVVALAVLWQRTKAMQTEMARVTRQLNESEQELAKAREDKTLLVASDMAMLGGTEMAANARARLSYDRQTGRAMLVADGLPPAPEGKAYQLWFIVEGKPPMPGGVFTTDTKGHAELRDQMPPEGRAAGVFAVTLERAGGVPTPEGRAYLQGKASS
jgi:anti-sigma-K factor RskA